MRQILEGATPRTEPPMTSESIDAARAYQHAARAQEHPDVIRRSEERDELWRDQLWRAKVGA